MDQTMKAADLSRCHLGHKVRVRQGEAEFTDMLRGVSHLADLIIDQRVGQEVPDYMIGRTETVLTLSHAGEIRVDGSSDVQIEVRRMSSEGIYTMTESEFYRELAEAWDMGHALGRIDLPGQGENPYRERKMTPAEIEEWRKTCPYPEALGNMAESEIAEANRKHLARFRDWKPGDSAE